MTYMRIFALVALLFSCSGEKSASNGDYHEQFRPQVHFSPKKMWTNDPNGMVYVNGVYHLFFQRFPDSAKWGPMHWGHAISSDLLHWKEQPIALYPDSAGYIFSGSAVIDSANTSGFGAKGQAPMALIFTHHIDVQEGTGTRQIQTQSLAYSLDEGKTFVKYNKNPVLPNPGIVNFRDPKVFWHEESQKWIMILTLGDQVGFYSSANLKRWIREGEFGLQAGAHGGVWECPDLFSITHEGEKVWILIVSVYPGAPNGGSGTQYFTGKFDGKSFQPSDTTTKWMDYGMDNYAGITWANTGSRKIFLGWMSNWAYADKTPTEKWRGAMTLPRELSLTKMDGKYYIKSAFIQELNTLSYGDAMKCPAKLDFTISAAENFTLEFSNPAKEKLVVGFDKNKNQYYIDRSASGKTDFSTKFPPVQWAPRIGQADSIKMSLVIDHSSIECIADDGLTVLTNIFFPSQPFKKFILTPNASVKINQLRSIWE